MSRAWLVVLMLGCGERSRPPEPVAFGQTVAAPITELGTCLDVAGRRACWTPQVADSARSVPDVPAMPADGRWRCDGEGAERSCRLERARPFRCAGGLCVQSAPRLPDDGMWECADVRGVVVCRGRSTSAGIVAGPPAPGWICGHAAEMRICVDLDPDWPDEEHRACRFRHEPRFQRECGVTQGTVLGGPCGRDVACPDGLACVGGLCLPSAVPLADCWTSNDCEGGKACVVASCRSS